MKLAVLTPHFDPDVAPTGVVVTRLVEELAARDHRIEVFTSLPWYRSHRVEPGFEGRLVRRESTPWGEITRIHPFPTDDKTDIGRRAVSFAAFTAVSGVLARRGGTLDAVLAVSPPLPLGLAGRTTARARNATYVFNVQDVFPDVAVEVGALTNRYLIEAAERLERRCYAQADAVTVLSDDLRENVGAKVEDPSKVRVIPNFVDTEAITPGPRSNRYRQRFGLGDKTVVMYAGNVGLSQSLDLVIAAASDLQEESDIVFVINGSGAARPELEMKARGLANIRFVEPQPSEDLPEVLAAADVHLIPLKRGLARSSVPSKTFSILAAGRPFIASVDPGSEVATIATRSGAGVAVPPEDPEAFTKSLRRLLDHPDELANMGSRGRTFVESWASPRAVAEAYESLFLELRAQR